VGILIPQTSGVLLSSWTTTSFWRTMLVVLFICLFIGCLMWLRMKSVGKSEKVLQSCVLYTKCLVLLWMS
jgi:hypothetical protein